MARAEFPSGPRPPGAPRWPARAKGSPITHRGRLTVAPFRAWRGSPACVAGGSAVIAALPEPLPPPRLSGNPWAPRVAGFGCRGPLPPHPARAALSVRKACCPVNRPQRPKTILVETDVVARWGGTHHGRVTPCRRSSGQRYPLVRARGPYQPEPASGAGDHRPNPEKPARYPGTLSTTLVLLARTFPCAARLTRSGATAFGRTGRRSGPRAGSRRTPDCQRKLPGGTGILRPPQDPQWPLLHDKAGH